jgi:hypothetical protein
MCCAPIDIQTNACKGSCKFPQSCPFLTGVELEVVKLPSGISKKINWRSANKGGGIVHKNFDEQSTKELPLKWYDKDALQ